MGVGAGAAGAMPAGATSLSASSSTLTPSSIASAEFFGTPVFTFAALAPAAITSTEAFGTPILTFGALAPASIASVEAFGTPVFTLADLLVSSIVSAESFGAASVSAVIEASGISSAEFFGAPQAFREGDFYAPGIGSAEAFGTPTAVFGALGSGSVASAESFGTPSLSLRLGPSSIPSNESFGAHVIDLALTPTSIPSAESFGTPALDLGLRAASVSSAESFGVPVIAGPLLASGISSVESLGRPLLYLPADLHVTPTKADFQGGTVLQIFGGQLDMSACQDDFSDSVLDLSRWADLSTGAATLTEQGSTTSLILNAGSAAGAIARADQSPIGFVSDFDAEASFSLTQDSRGASDARLVFAELGILLAAPASGLLSLQVGVSKAGFDLTVRRELNGEANETRAIIAASTRDATGAQATLRILRAGRSVRTFYNGALVGILDWFADLGTPFLGIRNDPTQATTVTSRVSGWFRRPVVRFGDYPTLTLQLRSRQQATATAPSVPGNVSTVDIGVTGCAGSAAVLFDAFTFTRPRDLITVGKGSRGEQLVILNDPRLTRRLSTD